MAEPADLAVIDPEQPEPVPVQKLQPLQLLTLAVSGLLLLAVFYTLYFAAAVFVPVALAVLLNLVLAPVVRRVRRLGIPEAAAAGVVLLVALLGIALAIIELSGPAAAWVGRAPEALIKARLLLADVVQAVQEVQKATEQMQELSKAEQSGEQAVVLQGPNLAELFVSGTWRLGAALLITITLLYFMLASGDLFLRKLVKVLPRLQEKKRAVEIAHETEREISAYLLTITVINACLGAITALCMFMLGLPNPVLWGAAAGVLNFIPYLGPFTTMVILSLASLLTFGTWEEFILPPLVFIGLATLEGQFITPILLGRRLTLNPVVIFLSLLAWGWLWGIPGALLAVPLLAAFKIFCDHIEPLAPIGEFLGRRDD
jgi:predicted PurR-regulated permease PerM